MKISVSALKSTTLIAYSFNYDLFDVNKQKVFRGF
jgi:hypothetical protein